MDIGIICSVVMPVDKGVSWLYIVLMLVTQKWMKLVGLDYWVTTGCWTLNYYG